MKRDPYDIWDDWQHCREGNWRLPIVIGVRAQLWLVSGDVVDKRIDGSEICVGQRPGDAKQGRSCRETDILAYRLLKIEAEVRMIEFNRLLIVTDAKRKELGGAQDNQ